MSMSKIMRTAVLTTLLAGAGAAQAVPIELTLQQQPPQTIGPQSESAPCIIAGTQCQNPANFPFTNFVQGGNIFAFNEDSPTYTISQFPFLSFAVAIDVNTAKGEERLLEFHAFVDADGAGGPGGFEEIYFFTGPSGIADPLPSNGNGYGDWTLEAIDLSAYASDALVFFNAAFDGASDGAESFFIVGREATVPEPGTLMLMSLGLLGLGLARRRRLAVPC
jgi:hypothetical protein